MSFHVQRKVVTARETPLANFAFERLCTRVLPIMARQLVRPGKLVVTLRPLTRIRLFSCVNSLMSLEVGALRVHLVATCKVAMVRSSLFQLRVVSPVVLQGGACGGFPRDGGGQGGGGGGAGGEGGGVGGVRRRWGVARAPGVGGRCQWEGQGVAHARAVT